MATKPKAKKPKKAAPKQEAPRPAGRPSDFTPELGTAICTRLIEIGSLRKVCEEDGMPDKSTVFRWLLKAEETGATEELRSFRDQYARARQIAKDYQFDEHWDDLRETALSPVLVDGVPLLGPDGKIVMAVTSQSVALARLKHDAWKWQASKENPKKYGDKIEMEHSGTIQTMSDEQVDRRMKALMDKARGNA